MLEDGFLPVLTGIEVIDVLTVRERGELLTDADQRSETGVSTIPPAQVVDSAKFQVIGEGSDPTQRISLHLRFGGVWCYKWNL